jgi:hypothetical protein
MKKVKLEVSIKYSEIEDHDENSGTRSEPIEIFWTPLELERCHLVDNNIAPVIDRRVLLGFLDHVKSQIMLGPNCQIRVDVESSQSGEEAGWKTDKLE